ncbi:MAG: flagellar motor protein [Bacillota bacterium]|jgi:chemotaxis protein MotA
MDIMAVGGLIIALCSLVLGFLSEGGHLDALLAPSAALIVFGGTIGATVISFSLKEIKTIPALLKIIFMNKLPEPGETIDLLVSMAEEARREGLLYLENRLSEVNDPFLRKGVQLVVDGTDPEVVKAILEVEVYSQQERHSTGANIFETAGGYAPTMGIIGTVMGLVHVLGNVESPEGLGPAIAMAFMATLYGVVSANVIWFPLGAKLQNLSKKELLQREIMMEGIISLQAGYNPVLIRERLTAFLIPAARDRYDRMEINE